MDEHSDHPDHDDDPGDPDEPVELEVTDVLDLHSFPPREVAQIVRDYLDLACERGFEQVRIIHGRGLGVQRETVRKILERDARVEAFGDAPAGAGGWGATWARLRRDRAEGP
jgi:dsDNA-specific endonuclease/ATPase MutS2